MFRPTHTSLLIMTPLKDIVSELKHQLKECKEIAIISDIQHEEEVTAIKLNYEALLNEKEMQLYKLTSSIKQHQLDMELKDSEIDYLKKINCKTIELNNKVDTLTKELDYCQSNRMKESSTHIRKIAEMEEFYETKLKNEIEMQRDLVKQQVLQAMDKEGLDLSQKYDELCKMNDRNVKKMKKMAIDLEEAHILFINNTNEIDLLKVAIAYKISDNQKLLIQSGTAGHKLSELERKVSEQYTQIAHLSTVLSEAQTTHKKEVDALKAITSTKQKIIDERNTIAEKELQSLLTSRKEMEVFLVEALTHIKKEKGQDLNGEWQEKERVFKYIFAKMKGII